MLFVNINYSSEAWFSHYAKIKDAIAPFFLINVLLVYETLFMFSHYFILDREFVFGPPTLV